MDIHEGTIKGTYTNHMFVNWERERERERESERERERGGGGGG